MFLRFALFFLLFFCNIVFVYSSSAQSCSCRNIAIIDTKRVMEKSDAGRNAQQLIINYQNNIKKKVRKYQLDIEFKKNELEKQQSILSEKKIEEKKMQLQKLFDNYSKEVDDLKNENIVYQQKLISKILDKINIVIEKMSKEKSFNLVFDRTSVLYVDHSNDITVDVIKMLDKYYKIFDVS